MITDENITKLKDFIKRAAKFMLEAEVRQKNILEYEVIIHTSDKGYKIVEKFLTHAPVNMSSLLNIVEAQRDFMKSALEISKKQDAADERQEPSEMTKLLEDALNPKVPDVTMTTDPSKTPGASA